MDLTGIIGPLVLIAIILAISIVVAAALISRRKPPFPGNRQPCQNQYQQYPGGPVPEWAGSPPQKRPGWAIPLAAVAAVAVIAAAMLGGILIGSRLSFDRGRAEIVSSAASRPEQREPSAPAQEPKSASSAEGRTETVSPEAPRQEQQKPSAPAQKHGLALSVGECLDEALDWIEDSADYVEKYTFEPLGCVDDFDGDGKQELLAAFQTRMADGTRGVSYALFSLSADGPKLLDEGVLYQEAGGNGGSVGIAQDKDGTAYLTRFIKRSDGNAVSSQYTYIPWDSVGEFDEPDSCYMEARWNVGEEEKGTYILGDEKVDKDRFEERRENYTVLYELNIAAGHGNGLVNGMDFDSLEEWYGD